MVPNKTRSFAILTSIMRLMKGGGGSRRFIYAPAKLDPNAASWMANKFQSAMPGALLGTDHIIAFLLHHFYPLYARPSHCPRRAQRISARSMAPRRWSYAPSTAIHSTSPSKRNKVESAGRLDRFLARTWRR
jgi:hypothetical protein